jgi:hypothetical protein
MDRWSMMDRDGQGGGASRRGSPAAAYDDPARWAPRLTRLLDRSCQVCRELDGLSHGQGGVVRSGDTDALMAILSKRQTLIDELSALNQEMEPFRRQWPNYMDRVPGTDRTKLQAMAAEMALLIKRIGERDDADRVALEAQREALAAEINGVRRGRGALAAYGERRGVRGSGAMYQDWKG